MALSQRLSSIGTSQCETGLHARRRLGAVYFRLGDPSLLMSFALLRSERNPCTCLRIADAPIDRCNPCRRGGAARALAAVAAETLTGSRCSLRLVGLATSLLGDAERRRTAKYDHGQLKLSPLIAVLLYLKL